MTLGIVAALHAEMRALTRQALRIGAVVHHAENTLLALSGIGPERARVAGKLLLDHGATALLSWGTAAALAGKLASGNLILPNTVTASNGTVFPASLEWHTRLFKQLSGNFKIHTEALVESLTILSNASDKRALFERSGAIAADMESAALAAVAHEAGIPFLAIRAIADSAAMTVPQCLMRAIDSTGRINNIRPMLALIVHPQEWLAVARLAWGFHHAQMTLTNVVKCTGGSLR